MRILIHDLPENPFGELPNDFRVISADGRAVPCQGCFKCWTKNAGFCVYDDALCHSGSVLGKAEQIVVVSRLCYGGYSASVKRFFDRGISDSLPFLVYRKGRTYHMNRYKTKRGLSVYFYGESTDFERETAREYVQRLSVNMDAELRGVFFADSAQDLKGHGL